MKLEAESVEDLIARSGEHEEMMRLIDTVILETAPDMKRRLVSHRGERMIGYGEMPDRGIDEEACPLIKMAPRKRTVNIYLAAEKEGIPLPCYYRENFGKSAIGNNCIRIGSLRKLDTSLLRELVRETLLWADLKYNRYGRHCAVTN